MRECAHCGSIGQQERLLSYASIDVGMIACGCGVTMCLPVEKLADAWNTRKNTDELLHACLGPLRTTVRILSDSGIDAALEERLIKRIAAHLAGGQI
jgi:hypothetical protein